MPIANPEGLLCGQVSPIEKPVCMSGCIIGCPICSALFLINRTELTYKAQAHKRAGHMKKMFLNVSVFERYYYIRMH